nr:MAG TPA: hypothetical protein [Caudoviricetes sp.]
MPVKGSESLSDGLSWPGRAVIQAERFWAVREAHRASWRGGARSRPGRALPAPSGQVRGGDGRDSP